MVEQNVDQLRAIWVDGQPVRFVAAALFTAERPGKDLTWQILISNASPAIEAGEVAL
jgi:hypothetical protein